MCVPPLLSTDKTPNPRFHIPPTQTSAVNGEVVGFEDLGGIDCFIAIISSLSVS